MTDSQFATRVAATQDSIDAFVVVGGTLLRECDQSLASANCRKRILFPTVDSPWLVAYLRQLGVNHDEYHHKISVNSSFAVDLGFDVRFHNHPVGSWYVVLDRTYVFQKPVGVLTGTRPTAIEMAEAGPQFTLFFESMWEAASPTIDGHTQKQKAVAPQSQLRVFLSHSSGDKERVRGLYRRLCIAGFTAWFDEIDLLPGQDFDLEIDRAVKNSDIVIVCLSELATQKRGYLQKELQYVLDVAKHQPEGQIFLIPVLLEQCDVPRSMEHLHYVRLFDDNGFDKLIAALEQTERQGITK